MATVKVKRTVLIEKMKERLEFMLEQRLEQERRYFEQKPRVTPVQDAEACVRLAQKEVEEAQKSLAIRQARLANAKKSLTAAKKSSAKVVLFDEEAARANLIEAGYGLEGNGYIHREIRLLELSDEEFVRVGTQSNLAQYL